MLSRRSSEVWTSRGSMDRVSELRFGERGDGVDISDLRVGGCEGVDGERVWRYEVNR